MARKRKNDFVTLITPMKGEDLVVIKNGRKFLGQSEANKLAKTVGKQFRGTVKKVRVKRVNPIEKTLRSLFRI